jgi:hypothetical protein
MILDLYRVFPRCKTSKDRSLTNGKVAITFCRLASMHLPLKHHLREGSEKRFCNAILPMSQWVLVSMHESIDILKIYELRDCISVKIDLSRMGLLVTFLARKMRMTNFVKVDMNEKSSEMTVNHVLALASIAGFAEGFQNRVDYVMFNRYVI